MNKKFCQNCGTPMDKDAEFCPNCGARQNNAVGEQKVNKAPRGPQENPITALKTLWNKMFTISDKSTRSQFWFGYLDIAIISILITVILQMTDYEYAILFLASIAYAMIGVAEFTNMVRRLHDANLSGHFLWLLLIPFAGEIAVIVLLCLPSKESTKYHVIPSDAWYKKWWTWLIIVVLTIVMFGLCKSYVDYVVYGIDNTTYSSDSSNSSSSKSSSDSASSDKSSASSSKSDDNNVKVSNEQSLADFKIGPLQFTNFKYGIQSESNITGDQASDLFDLLGGAAPDSFYKQGSSYKQILVKYTITNTSNDTVHFDGLMDNNDLLLPDGTQLNQVDSNDFYSNDNPDNMDVKAGAKMNVTLAIQLKDDKANNIPSGTYQFKTAEVDDSDYNTIGDPTNISLKF